MAILAAVGCGDAPTRPPIVWEGEHLRFGTDSDIELCAGTLPHLDGVAGHLGRVLAAPNATIDYYWLPDGLEPYCTGDPLGCTSGEHEVFSTLSIHQHEIVHALRWPRVMYLPLEEGLAEAHGDDWDPFYPVSGDVEHLLREYGGGRGIPGEAYPLAGHFVSYLRARHGVDALLAMDRASDWSDSFASFERVFGEVYQVDLLDELDRYEETYPRCDQTFYRDRSFDCGRNLVAAPDRPGEETSVTVSMSCEDPAVLGPRFDLRWTTATLDVQVPGRYFVFAGRADGQHAWPVRFRRCDGSCSDVGDTVSDGPFISEHMCLEQARYLFRFVEEEDSRDYVLRVMMLDDSSCQ